MRIGRLNLLLDMARNWIAIPLFSATLLIPCFWQSRIQAADLSSHIYNAWLASQIQLGAAPGLWISSQSNNVLFDLMLQWLFVHVGPDLAQRLAVSVSVLVFAWGAIQFIFRLAGRNWWFAAPCVAMLAYGFIFHMGLFNFYLSLGLCLWYLAIFWDGHWRIRALAAPLLIVAWTAHPFAVVWAVATAAYITAANSVQPSRRILLVLPGLAALVTARYFLTHRYPYSWSIDQVTFTTGANQIALFGLKYVPPFAGLLLIWAALLHRLIKRLGMAHLVSTVPFQLWLLNAAAVFWIPDRILFPQFGRPLGYIAQRLSLATALMMCAVLAAAPTTRLIRVALLSVAVLFFALLYTDHRDLNRMEDRLDIAVARLSPGQRVISSLPDQSLRSLCLYHDLDRACIGHCFSYANYEPSSLQFRIHARPGNGIVLNDYTDVDAVAGGRYIVQPRDLPVYLVYPCGLQFKEVCSRPLHVGETSRQPN
ncbi:MAG: hypothetical protein WB799_12485 [Candidatus Sulfotelmatobacter sp.]